MTYYYIADQALILVVYFWLIPLILIVCITVSISKKFLISYRFHTQHLIFLFPFIISLVIPLFLKIISIPPAFYGNILVKDIGNRVVLSIFIIQNLVSVWVVYAIKGYRWISVFTVLLELYFGFFWLMAANIALNGLKL